MAGNTDYRKTVERLGVEGHRDYIRAQMARARETADAARRSQCLANAIAANGMLLRAMDVGFVTGELNYQAIAEISQGIQSTPAFRSLMEDSGERLAQSGSVDALVRDLKERDRALSEGGLSDYKAAEVIRGVQAKVRAHTAQPRDYAILVAAHRLSSRKGKTVAPDGRTVEVVRRDLNRRLDGGLLSEETYRVLTDPDFRYVMENEKPEGLYFNALRVDGAALEQYPRRAAQLRAREAERARPAPEQSAEEPAAARTAKGNLTM